MKTIIFIVAVAAIFIINSIIRAWIYGATHNHDI